MHEKERAGKEHVNKDSLAAVISIRACCMQYLFAIASYLRPLRAVDGRIVAYSETQLPVDA